METLNHPEIQSRTPQIELPLFLKFSPEFSDSQLPTFLKFSFKLPTWNSGTPNLPEIQSPNPQLELPTFLKFSPWTFKIHCQYQILHLPTKVHRGLETSCILECRSNRFPFHVRTLYFRSVTFQHRDPANSGPEAILGTWGLGHFDLAPWAAWLHQFVFRFVVCKL